MGRDPATLRVSVHVWGRPDAHAGPARRQRLRDYAALGLSRTIPPGFGAVTNERLLDEIAEDCAAAGLLGEAGGA